MERSFVTSKQWSRADLKVKLVRFNDPQNPEKGSRFRSFSGHERNRMFLQTEDNFDEVSLVSGADFREDCRGFAILDFDQDGWLDFAVTSPQTPRVRLIRNTLGDDSASHNNHAYLRLKGGNHTKKANKTLSPRDPFGAQVKAVVGGKKRIFQLSCGEGFSTQNTNRIHIGMGESNKISDVEVHWPSGKVTQHPDIPAGSNVVLFETDQNK